MQFWKSLNELSLQASSPVCPNMEQFYSLDIYGQYSTYIPYTCPPPDTTLTFQARDGSWPSLAKESSSVKQRA